MHKPRFLINAAQAYRRLPRGRRNEIIAFLAGALAVGLWFALVLLADQLPAQPEEHGRAPSTQQLVREAAQRLAGEVAACLGRGGEKRPVCQPPSLQLR